MASSKKPSSPTPVEAIVHSDKRSNLPTADAHDLVPDDVDELVPVSYPRQIFSPMLVWQGKEALDDADLEVDAPPIYIQEKIDPRVLVENLRNTAKQAGDELEPTLFETFDGLSELDLVEFYQHSANWSNRMILGDGLQVMASLAERERLRGKVQMIYIDPPYGIKFGSNWQVSARKRDVKDGSIVDVAREVEQIKAFRDTWELGIHSYLTYLRDRLLVARDLLTESGSIFVQIGDENVHLVRSVLDEIFGPENFVASIDFVRGGAQTSSLIPAISDHLLFFARNKAKLKFRKLWINDGGWAARSADLWAEGPRGGTRRIRSLTELQEGESAFTHKTLESATASPAAQFDIAVGDKAFRPKRGWSTTPEGADRLKSAERLLVMGKSLRFKVPLSDFPYSTMTDLWNDVYESGFAAENWYVVQTSRKVIQRCLLMCTDPGDLVLDPTCGSGTTAYVAEQWGRRWITVDTSRVALALARQRLMGAKFPYYLLADSQDGRRKEESLTGNALPPALPENDIREGFVYERAQRITLKSIANNPDIKEGMGRAEIDAAIKRHADFELLYDRPYEDPKRIRVTGPFTVESLSPHRNLAGMGAQASASAEQADSSVDEATFEQSILDNLKAAGVQNGKRAERLSFDAVDPYAGNYIQAVGIRDDATAGAPKRVGISLGPQYGTVSPKFVKDAAREAAKDKTLDLLCVLGFAFDPQVLRENDDYSASDGSFDVAGERSLGRIPVLLVRMNSDLLMGDDLKKTGSGNLFTVFGEPDIEITTKAGQVTVSLRGVDVYDPTTGEVRSSGTDQVALWMIDTDYNGESFFVRHCYFTGGQDPYARLKKALKAEIDEDVWSSLYSTESRPFPMPSTGKIAVKVINDYGDEVVKIFEV